MATSLIQFTQGATTGTAGQALTVTTGTAVTVANNANTGVASWEISLVDVPSGSSLTTGLLAHSDNGSTPSASFTPDIAGGCYRVTLSVWTAINRVGPAQDVDIRNAVVLDVRGFASPPSQIWPLPLPATASGLPGNKPNELNLSGQERGYAGAGNDGLLDQRFTYPVITNINVSAGTTSHNLSALVFSNSNSISFGISGSTITGTVAYPAQTVQTQGIAVPSAGTQTATSGTVIFSNSNGISFGMSNSSVITASYTVPSVPSQTNQTIGLYGLGNTTQNSSTTLDARTLSFNGIGGITVGYSNGSIQISGPQTAAQTVQTIGLYGLGNTTQNSSTTLDARTLSFNGLGIVTVGYSNGSIQVSATTAAQSAQTQNVVVPSAGTQTATSGTVVFSNSNGISFGMSGSSRVTASYTVPSIAGLLSAINLSAGTTSNNLSAFVFSNSNNVSFGLNGSTITATITVPAQTNQTVGLYGLGNTTQNSSTTLDARTLSFNGLGIVTVGYSNGSIQISATTAAQSNQTEGMYALGNTVGQSSSSTFDARTMSVSGAGVISVGYSGNALIISANAGGQSVQTIGLYALGNTTQNSSTTLDARTLSFNGLGGMTVGYSNGSIQMSGVTTAGLISGVNLSAGTTSNNLTAFVFSNSNNVSFGLNGSTVTATISVPAQTNQTVGLYALGNTTQNSSTTFDARTLSFNGLGIVTVGYSNGSIQVSATTAAQTNQTEGRYAIGNTIGQSSSSTFDARTMSISGIGGASVGYSGNALVISAAPMIVSRLMVPEFPWMTNFSISNMSQSFQAFNPRVNMTATQANLLMALSGNTNSTGALTISLGIYTWQHSTLSLASSNSRQITWTSGTTTSNSSVYGGISGTMYRTVSLGNWAMTPGDYMLGMWFRTTNNGNWVAFGQEGPTIVNAQDVNETQAYLNGYTVSSYSSAMIASVNVTDTGYARTGGDALKQAGVIFLGSY